MYEEKLTVNQIYHGDCREVLRTFPEKSVDIIFADPPYNLQLDKELWRPNATKVNGVDETWDQFSTFDSYDQFTKTWLQECRRVLKDTGTIWVIGSYHNIFRVGRILQDLKFWILNDIVWIKNNPMPNFHGVRFTNAHETLIWAQKNKGSKYTFNYHAMKEINHGGNHDGNKIGKVQMRSDWMIPLCTGKERIKINGEKAHPTQKPEALLERVILSSTNPGDVILDPFFGSGTTGAVSKRLGRYWIGIEDNEGYILIAQKRIESVCQSAGIDEDSTIPKDHRQKRNPFSTLLHTGYLKVGQVIYFGQNGEIKANILSNGHLQVGDRSGSIHSTAREIVKAPCNGWMAWYYIDETTGKRYPIDHIRKMIREEMNQNPCMATSARSEL
jgi:site-specific DNA-methyltransferase (adenine-specific)